MIEKMFPLLSLPHGRSLGQEVLMEYALQLSLVGFVSVLRAALFFKHEAYSNEKEFRFLQIHKAGMSEVKWRARAYSLIRYREFDWRSAAPGALKKIIVGPANQDKASEFAKGCLRLSNLDNVEIVVSKIPYRAV
jgi:hypothetical protein